MFSSTTHSHFARVTSVSFRANVCPTPNSATRPAGHQFYKGWTKLQSELRNDRVLRTRLEAFDDSGSPRGISVQYSAVADRNLAELSDANQFTSYVDEASDLINGHAHKGQCPFVNPKLDERAYFELTEGRIACYFASDTPDPLDILNAVRDHCIDTCSCNTPSRSVLEVTPRSRRSSGLSARFSYIPTPWLRVLPQSAGRPVVDIPPVLSKHGGVRVELTMSKQWLASRGVIRPADWDGVDLESFCTNEIRRFVSRDMDSYRRLSALSDHTLRRANYAYRVSAAVVRARAASTAGEPVFLTRQMKDEIAKADEAQLVQDRLIGSIVVAYFDKANLVTYDAICEAARGPFE